MGLFLLGLCNLGGVRAPGGEGGRCKGAREGGRRVAGEGRRGRMRRVVIDWGVSRGG